MKKILLLTTVAALSCFTLSLPMDLSFNLKDDSATQNNKKVTLSRFSSKESEKWLQKQIDTLDNIKNQIKEIRIYNEQSPIITGRSPKNTFTSIGKHISQMDAMIDYAIEIIYSPKESIKPYTLTRESKNFPKSSAITILADIDMAFVELELAVQNPKNKDNKQRLINLWSDTNQKIELLKQISNNIKNSRTSYKERFGATLLAKALEILQLSIEKSAEILSIDLQDVKE